GQHLHLPAHLGGVARLEVSIVADQQLKLLAQADLSGQHAALAVRLGHVFHLRATDRRGRNPDEPVGSRGARGERQRQEAEYSLQLQYKAPLGDKHKDAMGTEPTAPSEISSVAGASGSSGLTRRPLP